MASYSPNISEKGSAPLTDDNEVLNLRPILEVFFHWWREILLLTCITAAIGGGLVFYWHASATPIYQATAQVTIARIITNVNLDASFRTDMNAVGPSAPDTGARRLSLVSLVRNGTIANAVLEELRPTLGNRSPASLMNQITASFGGGGDAPSDLIQITASADTPEKAALIANSWAKNYVNHVNNLYGEMPDEMAELVEVELGKAETSYETAQHAYEDFLAQNEIPTLTRQITEKQQVIATLQTSRQLGLQEVITKTLSYRQNVITTYLNAVQQNRLLALTGEQEANRTLVQNLIQAISDNRQLAFSTEHNARVQLFTQYADLELQNRLLAMQQEQNAKTEIFKAYSDADLKSKLTVFNGQVDDKVGNLVGAYATKQHVDQLLDEAKALQNQIKQAGTAGASSNSLPLLLLKIEAYAAGAQNAGPFQFSLAESSVLQTNVVSQTADIAVLIDTLTARSIELGMRINQQSQSLFDNKGYQLLDGTRPQDDALYAAMQEQYLKLFEMDDLAQAADTAPNGSVLSQAILNKYDELFGVGALTDASLTITDTTPIYAALQAQYPSLFNVGDLTQLGDLLASDSALDTASQQKLVEMLQPPADLDNYLAATDVSDTPILHLEEEVRALQASLEKEQAQRDRIQHNRDVALESYNALNSKRVELTLRRTASNREVSLAATANPPDLPIPGVDWVVSTVAFAVAGFLLALIIAFLAAYMDTPPFLSRLRQPQISPVSQASR
jgi:capsular polysaccharide biosynthesis protein